ncbi:hypothetical protein ACI8AA_23105 [Geodermatophilus sp. SYSU D01180]
MSDEVTVAIIAIVVSAVVSVVGIFFAFKQARSARQAATSAQEQAAAARESVAAAREQVAAAHRQNELQEQMWRDQSQPYVVADVRPDSGQGQMFEVTLENRGSTIARNVRVTFVPPLEQIGTRDEGSFTALDKGISYLPPGRAMTWHLGVGHNYFNGGRSEPDREVTVTCEGPFGPVEPLRYTFSFEAFRHHVAAGPGTLARVEKAVMEVAKELKAQRQR